MPAFDDLNIAVPLFVLSKQLLDPADNCLGRNVVRVYAQAGVSMWNKDVFRFHLGNVEMLSC